MENQEENKINKLQDKTRENILKRLREDENWNEDKEKEIQEEFKRQDEIRNIVDKIEERAKENISYLLENGRHEGEDNLSYALRKKLRSKFERERKRGYLFHISRDYDFNLKTFAKKGKTYYKPEHEN